MYIPVKCTRFHFHNGFVPFFRNIHILYFDSVATNLYCAKMFELKRHFVEKYITKWLIKCNINMFRIGFYINALDKILFYSIKITQIIEFTDRFFNILRIYLKMLHWNYMLTPFEAEFRHNPRFAHPWSVKIRTLRMSLNQLSFYYRIFLEWNKLPSTVSL